MAALTAFTPTLAGVANAGAAVAASDTIAQALLGGQGAYLEIINGNASTDNITISDAGTTRAGNALAGGTYAATVTNGTSKVFFIKPEQVDPSTSLVTVTHSVTTTVTYKLYTLP